MPFLYHRTVRFQDTDAAGVVYFVNVLGICHEAYEASLAASGISLKTFFSNASASQSEEATAIPIVHAEVDFFRPMFCGDRQVIQVQPQLISEQAFNICYQISPTDQPEQVLSQAQTRHVCINPLRRAKKRLPAEIIAWLHQWHADAAEPGLLKSDS